MLDRFPDEVLQELYVHEMFRTGHGYPVWDGSPIETSLPEPSKPSGSQDMPPPQSTHPGPADCRTERQETELGTVIHIVGRVSHHIRPLILDTVAVSSTPYCTM